MPGLIKKQHQETPSTYYLDMWIIAQEGFVSVVADRNEENVLLFRARNRADLENIVRIAKEEDLSVLEAIWEDPSADYRWRARIGKEEGAKLVAALLQRVDYDNFKSQIAKEDPLRAKLYGEIWETLLSLEDLS